jgi:hypothetical protein
MRKGTGLSGLPASPMRLLTDMSESPSRFPSFRVQRRALTNRQTLEGFAVRNTPHCTRQSGRLAEPRVWHEHRGPSRVAHALKRLPPGVAEEESAVLEAAVVGEVEAGGVAEEGGAGG